jgi:hypothetical protein
MRAAIYLRVSTDEQTTDNQERELRATAERAGHEVVAVYRDAGISGAKGRDKREHLEHPEGDVVFRHACKMGLEGIVSKRLGFALPVRPVARLAEVQEPRGACGEAGG